jgi:hypothetical protein
MFPANGGNVKLGKGSLFLAPLESDGSDRGFEDVGNVSSLSLASDTTTAEIYSSRQATAPLLARNVLRTAYTLTATCNEFTIENLRKWLQGEVVTRAQVLDASVTVTKDDVREGALIDLGARRVSGVVVTAEGTNVLVAGVDYSVSTEFGAVKLVKPEDGGSVTEGQSVSIVFAQPALSISSVRIAKQPAANCRLLFLSDDSNADGVSAHDRLELWKVSLAPEGELNLISDDYGAFQLTASVLSDASHPDEPYGNLERVAA